MRPDLPIIAASGLPENHHQQRASHFGTPLFLLKPCTTESIPVRLYDILPSQAWAFC